MKQKERDKLLSYVLGYTGVSALIALTDSMRRSKTLTVMVVIGLVGVLSFFYFLLNIGGV
ncbi:hypothetical protein NFC81_13105 [Salinispirillum sp. LH 10-3-1]|uniref:Uncharacterized protein n=1 Tax=Salinispirillum sp. LH 10-3-1 TaxID=2952525 RepID=A0AB38YE90_9GAMM